MPWLIYPNSAQPSPLVSSAQPGPTRYAAIAERAPQNRWQGLAKRNATAAGYCLNQTGAHTHNKPPLKGYCSYGSFGNWPKQTKVCKGEASSKSRLSFAAKLPQGTRAGRGHQSSSWANANETCSRIALLFRPHNTHVTYKSV